MILGQYADGKMVHFLQIPTLVAGFLQQSLDAMYEFVEILCDEIVNSFRPQEWLCDLVQLVSYVDGTVSQLHIRQGLGQAAIAACDIVQSGELCVRQFGFSSSFRALLAQQH